MAGNVVLALILGGTVACWKEPVMTTDKQPAPQAAPAAGTTASSVQADLKLTISASGTVVHFVLRNVGQAPLRLFGGVAGPDRTHYDYLRAELAQGGVQRKLRFTGARNASGTGVVTLPVGGEISDDLDLAAWAQQPVNGRQPLAAGDYQVTVIYELAQQGFWSGRVSAGPVGGRAP